jgi:hypothetical protein
MININRHVIQRDLLRWCLKLKLIEVLKILNVTCCKYCVVLYHFDFNRFVVIFKYSNRLLYDDDGTIIGVIHVSPSFVF